MKGILFRKRGKEGSEKESVIERERIRECKGKREERKAVKRKGIIKGKKRKGKVKKRKGRK